MRTDEDDEEIETLAELIRLARARESRILAEEIVTRETDKRNAKNKDKEEAYSEEKAKERDNEEH